MARASVPKFGDWESEQNVPYTVFFDKARQNKGGGKMINPNDPSENPEMFAHLEPSKTPPPPQPKPRARQEEPIGRRAVRPAPEHRTSREDGDFRQFNNSSHLNEPNYGGRGQRQGRSARSSIGSEQSFERSPLHPQYPAKIAGRGGGSPAWEGRSHESSHATAAKSRLRPIRDQSPERGAAVPRFGEWNENDPQSAENFTQKFEKVREERNNGGVNASATPNHYSPYAQRNLPSSQPKPRCWQCCIL